VARWDETPAHVSAADATPGTDKQWDATPSQMPRRNRWDETPKESMRDGGMTPGWGSETPRDIKQDMSERVEDTPGASKRRSRWDLTPTQTPAVGSETPMNGMDATAHFTPKMQNGGMTPSLLTPGGSTPIGTPAMGMKTPAAPFIPMTPEQAAIYKWEKEIDDRNRPLSDEELDALMPPGYKVLAPPSGIMQTFICKYLSISFFRICSNSYTGQKVAGHSNANGRSRRWIHDSTNAGTRWGRS
jgi:splicing factor 3B subunit 1